MKKIIVILPVLLITHLLLLSNLRFTAWPEMLSYPYLVNSGFSLYKDMIHPYPPLLTGLLSYWYSWFGYGLSSLKALTWGIILVNDVLIYHIIKLATKSSKYSLLGLSIYVFLQPFLEGNMLWFDLVLVPFVLAGLYFAIRSFQKGKWHDFTMSGYFLFLASLVKQTAGIYLLIYVLTIFIKRRSFKEIKYSLIAPFIIGATMILKLFARDSLSEFLSWTLIYPLTEWGKFPGYVQMSLTNRQLWIIFLLFLPIVLLLINNIKKFVFDRTFQLLIFFLLGSQISIYPRFSFFHFQLALVLVATIVVYLLSKRKAGLLYILPLLVLVWWVHIPLVKADWGREARFYGGEDIKFSEVIQENVNKDERVFLLGPHSGYYALSDRLPSVPWTDNFGWYLEIPGVQEDIIRRWETNPPDKIIWTEPRDGNWHDLATYQPQTITNWIFDNYNQGKELKENTYLWQREN